MIDVLDINLKTYNTSTDQSKTVDAVSTPSDNSKATARIFVSERDLIRTHAKEMYCYLRRNVRFEKKITVTKQYLLNNNWNTETVCETQQINEKMFGSKNQEESYT